MFKKGDIVYINKKQLKKNLKDEGNKQDMKNYGWAMNTNDSFIVYSIDSEKDERPDIYLEKHIDHIVYPDELISKKEKIFKKELKKILKDTDKK